MNCVVIIGSGVRETSIAKRLYLDTNKEIKLIVISDKFNPQMVEYSYRTFKVNDYLLTNFLMNDEIENLINNNFKEIEFVVIGPEIALKEGYADFFESINVPTIGPKINLAKLEWSKQFCREFLRKNKMSHLSPMWCKVNGLSRNECKDVFSNLSQKHGDIVIKRDGLCGGKGVIVQSVDFTKYSDAEQFIFENQDNCGELLFEERLIGEEFSLMSLYNPNGNIYHFPPIQDYKRRFNGNQGPNTGSMGCLVSQNNSLHFLTDSDITYTQNINKQILENSPGYRGVLYGSYIKTTNGIKLIEINCRFGDPECVVALELLNESLYDLFKNISKSDSEPIKLTFKREAVMGIYMVPRNYGSVSINNTCSLQNVISFNENYKENRDNIFMGDVRYNGESYFTGTSRTLFICHRGSNIAECIDKVNNTIKCVNGTLDYRTDIGSDYKEKAYEECGVSVNRANEALKMIKSDIVSTYNHNVTSEYGSFSGEYKLGSNTLLASIDGVGTKSKFVIEFLGEEGYLNLGMDLINHSINDILVQGGKPLFFLDYFGTGKLNPIELRNFVSGIASECKKYDVVLIGGETAEMPGFYTSNNSSELVGCIVGVKDSCFKNLNKNIETGDVLVYFESSGPHTNGYSYIRKLDLTKEIVKEVPELLDVHKCYYGNVMEIIQEYGEDFIKGMCHITGGGLFENLARVIPKELFDNMEIKINELEIPIWADFLKDCTGITLRELFEIFNCGVGYVLIISPDNYARIIEDENNNLTYLGKL
jgi:phosphoribosylamine--glycine ligase / phosphoribosylformylglycinamidine cyclo-ligase